MCNIMMWVMMSNSRLVMTPPIITTDDFFSKWGQNYRCYQKFYLFIFEDVIKNSIYLFF